MRNFAPMKHTNIILLICIVALLAVCIMSIWKA